MGYSSLAREAMKSAAFDTVEADMNERFGRGNFHYNLEMQLAENRTGQTRLSVWLREARKARAGEEPRHRGESLVGVRLPSLRANPGLVENAAVHGPAAAAASPAPAVRRPRSTRSRRPRVRLPQANSMIDPAEGMPLLPARIVVPVENAMHGLAARAGAAEIAAEELAEVPAAGAIAIPAPVQRQRSAPRSSSSPVNSVVGPSQAVPLPNNNPAAASNNPASGAGAGAGAAGVGAGAGAIPAPAPRPSFPRPSPPPTRGAEFPHVANRTSRAATRSANKALSSLPPAMCTRSASARRAAAAAHH
jgi:hypothetical protein